MSAERGHDLSRFSEAQRRAITSFGSDVCVNAGAGSGKTSVLVHRFVHAVLARGASPENILTLTFTEKAANEMKERLVEEFGRLGRQDDRRALESAYIGTIDGFCARLLRENPIEAEVDPGFKVLSESEADLLASKTMDAVFEAQAQSAAWIDLLVSCGETRLRAAMLHLHELYFTSGAEERLLEVRDLSSRLREAGERIDALLAEGKQLAGPSPSAKNAQAALAAAEAVPPLLRKRLDWEAFDSVRAALKIDKRGKALKEWALEVDEWAAVWSAAALQCLFAPQKEEFLRVFRQFKNAYGQQKRASGTYDFCDLPYLAYRLLSSDEPAKRAVRRRCADRFHHVFIDEFQDTSPLQARLLDLLRGKGNLFVVGDPQQSIYAFRRAEPALFADYEAAAGMRVSLTENYRSRRAVLDFANSFFAEAFPAAVFRPLECKASFGEPGEGQVELSAVRYGPHEPAKSLDEARRAEAACLADRLIALTGPAAVKPLRWGEIAVLFRKRTALPIFEREFSARGVPFYSLGSRGFFERPEVKDLIHFLALLDHPDDDIALASVLRSPLAGVSDDGLFWLSRAAKRPDRHAPLAAALGRLSSVDGLDPRDSAKAGSFHSFIEGLRTRKNRYAVSGLIEEALRWSSYECAALTDVGGAQRIANVRKLVEMARSLEEKTAIDAAAFVRHARAVAEDETESEARVESLGGDAVLFASIHAAKGLEFPCVVVADAGAVQGSRGRGLVLASASAGLGWSAVPPGAEKALRDAAYEEAAAVLDRKERAEEDRLFYVAVTRAKERLILSGAVSPDAERSTWMARASKFLGISEPRAADPSRPRASGRSITPKAGHGLSAEQIAEKLRLPEKTYDLAVDLTVTDLLSSREPARDRRSAEREHEEFDPEDLERSPRNEYGTIFHRLMEVMALGRPRGSVSGEFADKIVSPLTVAERGRAREAAAAFWGSALGLQAAAAVECYPELPFIYKTPYGILKGQIDLVFRDRRGEWTLLDYKTNAVDASTVGSVAASYEYQLGLYALVFSRLYGAAPSRGVLYFSSIGLSREYIYGAADLQRFASWLEEAYLSVVAQKELAP